MSSRIIRSRESSEIPVLRWDVLPHVGSRQTTTQRQSPDAGVDREELERNFQARVQKEKEQAYRQGEAAARQAAAQQLEAECARLARAVEEASGYKKRLRAQAEREVVDLALAVARRILRREISIDPEAVLGLVKSVLEKISLREVTEIRVAPPHVTPLTSHLGRIGAPEAIRISGDPALELGALLLHTSQGIIDASAQTQLEEISRGFTDLMGGAQ